MSASVGQMAMSVMLCSVAGVVYTVQGRLRGGRETMGEVHEEDTMHPRAPRRQMTRRQFLSYTLGAAGAFMAGGVIIPMIRFAIDPLLKPKAAAAFVKVAELSKISQEPVAYSFQTLQVDGWIEKDVELTAWIAKSPAGDVIALSPVCKHLGCTIDWNSNPQYPNEFFCPCHAARYTPIGKNLAISPAPLDEYEVKIENGFVYLGGIRPNTRVS